MFGTDDSVGRKFGDDEPMEVVGVVGDVRYVGLDKTPQPAFYIPVDQESSKIICLVARLAPNAGDTGGAVRGIVHDLDPAQPAMKTTTIDQIVNESVANRRFYTTATSAFAAVALVLTLVGLVMIVARSVVERRRELAIRSALGARSDQIVSLVLRQGLTPVLAGAAAGLAGAYLASTALAQFLFQVAPHAPIIYAAALVLILAVAAAAVLTPARRAAGVEPATVLRAE
jgi:ABC-type antimicrobial peptide transport system permease subunit